MRVPVKYHLLVRPGILPDSGNAHLIKAPHVTDLVELLMTATVHTCTIRIQWQSEVTRPPFVNYPDSNETQN